MRAARNQAPESADVRSAAPADRLRIDGTVKSRKHGLLAWRQVGPRLALSRLRLVARESQRRGIGPVDPRFR